jgi:EsV-1-7 cysteine-rich motif
VYLIILDYIFENLTYFFSNTIFKMPIHCQTEGCKKQPVFNYQDEKSGLYCASHKKDGMVDVKHKLCEHPECDKQPAFDNPGGKGRFCGTHKTAGMINVKSKRCEHSGCDKKNPVFDMKGGKGRFCNEHKTAGMVNVKSKRCEYPGCDTRASFGKPGGKDRFCAKHKTVEMVDLRSKQYKIYRQNLKLK